MDAKLFLAQLLAQGHVIPENAYEICVNTDDVEFRAKDKIEHKNWNGQYTWMSNHIDSIFFENEQVGYDKYTLEFEDNEFTVEEFNQWLADHPNIIEEQKELQRVATKRLAELADTINAAIAEGEKLAAESGLPFMVKLGGEYQDVRKLASVDWNSSSMYC